MNYLIQQTQTFTAWHSSVRDLRAKSLLPAALIAPQQVTWAM
jgi:putative component of toxin-antitoxin plasmid stabilization module